MLCELPTLTVVIVIVIVVVVMVVVVAVNVFGVVAVTQAFLPLLKSAAKQGASPRVVFVSSVVGSAAMAETAPYSSSKFAVQAIAVCAHLTHHRNTYNAARCGIDVEC
jgi:NAD(P)-dependent dehydrogenase (short-subunit alcohol dehydrogenase family)